MFLEDAYVWVDPSINPAGVPLYQAYLMHMHLLNPLPLLRGEQVRPGRGIQGS